MPKKYVPIKYTSREFATIKADLLDYVRRYYPQTYQDFSEASFGSLMIDTVAYIGDILSFYLDYQANESFLHTAVEYNNIIKLGKQLGYRHGGVESSWGMLTFYISVPANPQGTGPDKRYMPTLRKGSTFKADGPGNFILNEDVDFAHPENEVRVGSVNNETGLPLTYAVKAQGQVVSGMVLQEIHTVGAFEPFRRIEMDSDDITEFISVVDLEGHEYFQVDYLSQDVVWRPVSNRDETQRNQAPMVLKPFTVPRRFVIERNQFSSTLVFGVSGEILNPNSVVADPSLTVLKMHGKSYINDVAFDPARLITSDKFGVAPSQTELTITYRTNSSRNVNARTRTVNNVEQAVWIFPDPQNVTVRGMLFVRDSLECDNEEPIIGDVTTPTSTEIKRRIHDVFATQNRAVTQQDYETMVYQMPKEFGGIKRCKILRDSDSLKRNLNLYVISENRNRMLTPTNDSVKRNIKTWVLKNKMINDTVDILNAKIVNFGLDFVVVAEADKSKFDVLNDCYLALSERFSNHFEIGEPFYLTEVYSLLNKVSGVADVSSVKLLKVSGESYSNVRFDFERSMSPDGRYINVPENVIMEIKFPSTDAKGVVL
jgi:hypothetical protein